MGLKSKLARVDEYVCDRVSSQRRADHGALSTDDMERIGVAGELAFARRYKLSTERIERRQPRGDGGYDFVVSATSMGRPVTLTVDVKTTSRPGYGLFIKPNRPFADLYVLAEFDEEQNVARLLGWKDADDIGEGYLCKMKWGEALVVPQEELEPMSTLDAMKLADTSVVTPTRWRNGG